MSPDLITKVAAGILHCCILAPSTWKQLIAWYYLNDGFFFKEKKITLPCLATMQEWPDTEWQLFRMFDEPLEVRSSRENSHERGSKFVDGRMPKSYYSCSQGSGPSGWSLLVHGVPVFRFKLFNNGQPTLGRQMEYLLAF